MVNLCRNPFGTNQKSCVEKFHEQNYLRFLPRKKGEISRNLNNKQSLATINENSEEKDIDKEIDEQEPDNDGSDKSEINNNNESFDDNENEIDTSNETTVLRQSSRIKSKQNQDTSIRRTVMHDKVKAFQKRA
jgi:hypothetical protein